MDYIWPRFCIQSNVFSFRINYFSSYRFLLVQYYSGKLICMLEYTSDFIFFRRRCCHILFIHRLAYTSSQGGSELKFELLLFFIITYSVHGTRQDSIDNIMQFALPNVLLLYCNLRDEFRTCLVWILLLFLFLVEELFLYVTKRAIVDLQSAWWTYGPFDKAIILFCFL